MMPPEPAAPLRPPVQAYVVGPYTFRQWMLADGTCVWEWAKHGVWTTEPGGAPKRFDLLELAMADIALA